MCWGVRNMKRYQLATVTSPSVEFEIGGYAIQTKLIPDTNKNPNFDEPLLFLDIVSILSHSNLFFQVLKHFKYGNAASKIKCSLNFGLHWCYI